MYFKHLETNAQNKRAHDDALRANAARRLGENQKNKHLTPRPTGGGKPSENLQRRRADYSAMVAKSRADGWCGYHRPGSNH